MRPNPLIIKKAYEINTKNKLKIYNDPIIASRGSNVLYTDVWSSMGEENTKNLKMKSLKVLLLIKTY